MASDLATDLGGALASEAFKRAATLQVVFASICADEGVPLTEVQAVLLAQVALDVFDGTQEAFADTLTCDSQLRTGRFPYDPEVGS